MTITRALPLAGALLGALLLSTGCGGPKAPESPKALAELVVKALAEGNAETLKAALPTKADLQEAASKAGEEMPAEKIDAIVAKMSAKVGAEFAEILAAAKEAKVDWTKVTVGAAEAKEKVKKDLTEYRITVQLTAGDETHEMQLRAAKVDRGLVLTRKPRIAFGGLCDKVVANLLAVAASSDDAFGKKMAAEFAGKRGELIGQCKQELDKKPESRKQMECQVTARDFKAFMACAR
jgi:hypothetical protein